ncbi:hypothetical protein BB560_002247 [Smittium megazygosporum]|uniref:Uncharacterized protein n=1 Tax=Smittium megazygosporum TaxID=133381 RepID=A0A2T9ZFA5_9FUNG|nr:hypothetical protein BB560_002247 [Smittium megazygosporum]
MLEINVKPESLLESKYNTQANNLQEIYFSTGELSKQKKAHNSNTLNSEAPRLKTKSTRIKKNRQNHNELEKKVEWIEFTLDPMSFFFLNLLKQSLHIIAITILPIEETPPKEEPSPEEEDLWESWRQIEAFIIFCGNKRYSAINGSSISFVNQLSSCFVDRFQQDHYIKLLWSKIYTKSDDLDEKEGKYEYLGLQNGIQRNSNPVSVDKARENYLNNRNNLNFIRTTSNESNITINLNGSFERVQIGRQFGPKGEALYGKKQFRFDDSMTNKKPIVYTPKITMKEIKNLNRVSKAILAEFRTNLLKYIRSLNTT